MFPYIICTCGRSLGDIYEAYQVEKRNHVKHDTDVEMLVESSDSVGHILDKLHLKEDCCRGKMMTQITFNKYY
ncbi:hypothetical protein D5b_00161 [Faustovirus]|nr:hypothetical protein D5b_00161 [Faustovirus]AMN84750.1 hypothetical protein D6_00350 [Faustovirus]AMP44118.1 hypothetical protein PRJ_Dakar_00159 [Faustovirus]QKE50436.1 DNA-directed RNA polymerase [Faustovirus]